MICIAGILLSWSVSQERPPADVRSPQVSLEEKLLATAPPEWPLEGPTDRPYLVWHASVRFSKDGRRVAFVGPMPSRERIFVNGIRGEEFELVWGAFFSQDGNVLASRVTKGGKQFVCLGEVKHELFGDVVEWIVSPDGRRWAYLAATGKPLERRYRVVVDGIPGEEFSYVDRYSIQFSPDSKRVAYKVIQDDLMIAVLDGAKSPGFRILYQILFIAGGRQVAFLVSEDGNMCFFVDGKKRPEAFYGLTDLVHDPEGRLIGYIRQDQHQPERAVINGVPQEPFDEVRGLTFSPDGRRATYRATLGSKQFVMVDRERIESPGKSMWPGPFSPDGRRFACLAWDQSGYTLIVDGVVGEAFDLISSPTFSPDGRHIAYVARRGGKMLTVLDGTKGEELDFVDAVAFSSDSRKVFYGARKSHELWWKVRNVPESVPK